MIPDDLEHLVALQFGLTAVLPEERLYEDLGAESMDLVNLAVAIEDRYQIFIPEEKLAELRTVGDVYTLVQHYLDAAP